MIQKRPMKYEDESKDIINFLSTKTMSIWDNADLQAPAADYSNSKYLNKRLGDGDSLVLTFKEVMHKEQRDETPELYRTSDGKEYIFYFTDESGGEAEMTQGTTRGKFFSAMRDARVEPGETINVKRTGTGVDTEYTVTREGTAPVNTEEVPF